MSCLYPFILPLFKWKKKKVKVYHYIIIITTAKTGHKANGIGKAAQYSLCWL